MTSNPAVNPPRRSVLQVLDEKVLSTVTGRAAGSTRRRANWNLHPVLEDPIQRFCNAIEPDSYVRPHRHVEPGRWELFLALRGRAVIVTFDDAGRLSERVLIASGGPRYAVEIPPGAWHTVASLESGTVLFELKPGPYVPLTDKDFAAWAPAEGNAACPALLTWFKHGQIDTTGPSSECRPCC